MLEKYNEIVACFIETLKDRSNCNLMSKLQRTPFYVYFMLGDETMREVYARVLVDVRDDNSMKQVRQENRVYFVESMCNRILHSVPEVAMYDGNSFEDRRKFLKENWQQNKDRVNFVGEVTPEDLE